MRNELGLNQYLPSQMRRRFTQVATTFDLTERTRIICLAMFESACVGQCFIQKADIAGLVILLLVLQLGQ